VRRSVADVLAALRAEALATPDADAPARAALVAELRDDLPWYLRAAMGVGAWTATAFFLAFLMLTLGVENHTLRLTAGAALVGAAFWVRRTTDSEFMRQAAVAASLAGQGLMLAGFHELFDSARATAVFSALLSVVLIWFMPDRTHRFLSTLAFVVATFVAVIDDRTLRGFEIVTLTTAALTAAAWRARLAQHGERVAEVLVPVGYGLVLALFAALLFGTSTRFGHFGFDSGRTVILGRATTIGIMIGLTLLVWKIGDEQGESSNRSTTFAALAGVVALGLTTLSSPGIIAGAAVLTLAFDRRDRVLLGMGVIFLLVFGSVYYYSMHITLLEKSGVLAGSGALLVAIRQRLARV
jgi:Domain of unknown function (DUF4401)